MIDAAGNAIDEPTRHRFCASCGAQRTVDASFCAACGNAFAGPHEPLASSTPADRAVDAPAHPVEGATGPKQRRKWRTKVIILAVAVLVLVGIGIGVNTTSSESVSYKDGAAMVDTGTQDGPNWAAGNAQIGDSPQYMCTNFLAQLMPQGDNRTQFIAGCVSKASAEIAQAEHPGS